MGSVKEIKDRVQDAIDKGTTAVEKVHQDIMHKPIEVLESIAPDLPLTKAVATVQRKIVGIVYDVIRGVNRAAGELADGVLGAGPRPAKEVKGHSRRRPARRIAQRAPPRQARNPDSSDSIGG